MCAVAGQTLFLCLYKGEISGCTVCVAQWEEQGTELGSIWEATLQMCSFTEKFISGNYDICPSGCCRSTVY